jgi:hypothetical protein
MFEDRAILTLPHAKKDVVSVVDPQFFDNIRGDNRGRTFPLSTDRLHRSSIGVISINSHTIGYLSGVIININQLLNTYLDS